jgi:hypothetical protein
MEPLINMILAFIYHKLLIDQTIYKVSIINRFFLMNKLDEAYIHRINQDARIIKNSKMDWSVDEVNRFAALLKIENAIGQTLKIYEIDGSKLFDL